jgi:hypothetical protein
MGCRAFFLLTVAVPLRCPSRFPQFSALPRRSQVRAEVSLAATKIFVAAMQLVAMVLGLVATPFFMDS